MRQKHRTLLTVFLLSLFMAGQSVSAFSVPCSMASSPPAKLEMSADGGSQQLGLDMSHAHHAMVDTAEKAPVENCCGCAGTCLMALCSALVAAVNTLNTRVEIFPFRPVFHSQVLDPNSTASTLLRPPIIV